MSVVGDWDVTIKTPIGSLAVAYTFTENAGIVGGTATGKGETVPLRNITAADDAGGQRVT